MIFAKDIEWKSILEPRIAEPEHEPVLPEETYRKRLDRVTAMMQRQSLDYLFIYGDREHYSNFEYLSGFDLRFEEGLLMLSAKGEIVYILGNECVPLAKLTRLPAQVELYQAFSLPSQPIDRLRPLSEIVSGKGLHTGHRVGIVGWKLMAPRYVPRDCYDLPQFILNEIEKVVGADGMLNVTDAFIDPDSGIRIDNDVDEIAYLEYGAAWASIGLMDMLSQMSCGMSEFEASRLMRIGAMPQNSHPLTVVGANNDAGMVRPGNTKLELGERFNCSLGLRGGLSCRTGYLAYGPQDLPLTRQNYLDVLAKPYYAAVVNWYESIAIGAKASDIFNMIDTVLPKAKYNWKLNTGHYVATEEWVSSPFEADSNVVIRSGMCLQMDIIPGLEGYAGANCEDGIAVADAALRRELEEKYPDVWLRMQARRRHMIDVLHINLAEEVLPLSNFAGVYRPFMLNRDMALAVK